MGWETDDRPTNPLIELLALNVSREDFECS